MSDDELPEESKRFRYVWSFNDRHGHRRHYFRRGKLRVPLPDPGYGDAPSGAFMRKYNQLIKTPIERTSLLRGAVYVVGFGGYVKIGFSTDVVSRITQLQTGCPELLKVYLIVEGSRDDEKALHARFAEHRLLNEWFRHEGPLAQWLESQKGRVDEAVCQPVDEDAQTPSIKSMA